MIEINKKTFDISDKTIIIVDSGLSVIPKGHFEFMKVTDSHAVESGNLVYCTSIWYENYLEKVTKPS